MSDLRPGLNLRRLVNLMKEAIRRCQLDLSNAVVLTEAASGAYVVTPVLAAMAGARHVFALTRTTRYGSVEEIASQLLDLTRLVSVDVGIQIVTERKTEIFSQADIITNCGHVRPIDAEIVSWMKATAVISLMYEAWEIRPEDIDLNACRQRPIPVAGINERHAAVDVFSFLGIMAVKLLLDSGVAVYGCRVLLLCDNHFAPYLVRGLGAAGASVDVADNLPSINEARPYDAIVVALQPRSQPIIGGPDSLIAARWVADRWPGALVNQFWGDLDRDALTATGVPYWPREAPAKGHMGILPSAVGPEPIVSLQAGGLKVGELLWRSRLRGASSLVAEQEAESAGWGQRVTV